MRIEITPFGLFNRREAFKYTFTNNKGSSCSFTNLGGCITSIRMPDKKGNIDEVILGFDDIKQYAKNPGFLGALIGPVGNRISGAAFEFENKKYAFAPNENGTTLLHSVPFGFDRQLWDASVCADADRAQLVLRHSFLNAQTGFPGNIEACVTYTFFENDSLRIDYKATSDAPTFMSPTNHTYFNIAGTGKKRVPSVNRQTVQVYADKYTVVAPGCIPIKNESVEGTPFDLRQPVKLGDGFKYEKENEQMQLGSGYDHNFILSEQIDLTGLRRAATVSDRISGRVLDVYTDMPAMQLYTANHLRRYNASEKRWYGKRKALCLETQCTPDSIHHEGEEGFQVMKFDKEHHFSSSTVYSFGIIK